MPLALLTVDVTPVDWVGRILQAGEEAIAFAKEAQNDWILSLSLVHQGINLRTLRADPKGDKAEKFFKEAFYLRYRMSDRYGMSLLLLLLASTALSGGSDNHRRRAAILFGGQSKLSGQEDRIPTPGLNQAEFETAFETTRETLGQKIFEKMFAMGARFSLSELADFAMSERTAGSDHGHAASAQTKKL